MPSRLSKCPFRRSPTPVPVPIHNDPSRPRTSRRILSHSELSTVAAELKQKAKAVPGSCYVKDGLVKFPRPSAAEARS